MSVYVVIMAGGKGERLWPASLPTRPKPFLPLAGGEALIKAAHRRALALTDSERVYLVAERELATRFQELLDLPQDQLIVEPEGKNTAPAVGLGALVLSQIDPQAIMVVLPADHLIPDQKKFKATVEQGMEAARAGYLVTMGIKPTHPATGYGYIKQGPPLVEASGVFQVERFVEKPELPQAEKFLAQGGYLWNAGIFLWQANRILEEIGRFLPRLSHALEALRPHWGTPAWEENLPPLWEQVERISIDYGVLERAEKVAVVPAEFTWYDLGDWRAVWESLPKDEHGVASRGEHWGEATSRTLIWGQPGKPVATLGVSDLAIVDTPQALLVTHLSRTQEVRELAKRASSPPNWDELRKVDGDGMLEVVASFPEQCRAGLEIGDAVQLPLEKLAGFSRVLCVGMGGSGFTGDLLSLLLTCEVIPCRGYQPPSFIGEETLVVGISYSGNTEETLSAFGAALSLTRRALAVSSGGKLRDLCAQEGVPWIEIPAGLQPRAALGYLLFPLLSVFHKLGVLPEAPGGAIPTLARQASELGAEDSPARQLAQTFHRHVPLIYGSHGLTGPVAFRWKTQINENAKQPAFWAELPELCHNEIVGWELTERVLPNAQVVFLRTPADHPRVGARIQVLKGVLARRGLPYSEVWAQGDTPLERLLSLVYLGDWVSVYLALLNRVDPTPVDPIEELKTRLAELPWDEEWL